MNNKTPYAIQCNGPWDMPEIKGCGKVYLTAKEWDNQMMNADAFWKCPKCRGAAMPYDIDYDEDDRKEYFELLEEPCINCRCRDSTSTTQSGYVCLVGGSNINNSCSNFLSKLSRS